MINGPGAVEGMKEKMQWEWRDVKPTDDEIRKLVGKSLEVGIRAIWDNNAYSFGGRVYVKNDGGPTGYRVVMAASRCVMMEWGDGVRERMREGMMRIFLGMNYVDDGRWLVTMLKKGLRWNMKKRAFLKDVELPRHG